MNARNTTSGFGIEGRIDQRTHKTEDLREAYPDWDSMDEGERLEASRTVEPIEEETFYNVTTDRLHEYFVDNLDPGQTGAKSDVTTAWLQLGTDNTTPTTSDTSLTAPTYEETVTDVADNGKELLASTFLDSTEGNSNTFVELGLWSGDPANSSNSEVFLMNHATFSGVTKDNSKTVTFDVTLSFSDT